MGCSCGEYETCSDCTGGHRQDKPPLGVMPRWRHNELRTLELLQAMLRYTEVGKPMPIEWVQELTDLNEQKS